MRQKIITVVQGISVLTTFIGIASLDGKNPTIAGILLIGSLITLLAMDRANQSEEDRYE